MAEKIQIGGELISIEESHIVVSTDAVYDKVEKKTQQEVNASLKSANTATESKVEIIDETVKEHTSSINTQESRVTSLETKVDSNEGKLAEIQEKHASDVDMLKEAIEVVVSTNLATEAEIRENADSILDDKILEINNRLDLDDIHYVGIAVSLEQLQTVTPEEMSWALVGTLDSLTLYAYYPGIAPTGITPDTWVSTGQTYNFAEKIGIYTGLDYIIESESAYEQRKQNLQLEKNKFYFTYEDD